MKKLTIQDIHKKVKIAEIRKFCKENNLVLKSEGYYIEERPISSAGQIQHIKNELRQQITESYGKYNYAFVAIFQVISK